MEELVLAEEHTVRIEPGEDWDFPEFDYETRFPNSSAVAEKCIERLKVFLGAKYIVDDFVRHEDRQVWKINLEIKYGPEGTDYLNMNSLRGNYLTGLSGNLFYLDFKCKIDFDEDMKGRLDEVGSSLQSLRESYDDLDNTTRLQEVKRIKTEIYNFLTYLVKQEK